MSRPDQAVSRHAARRLQSRSISPVIIDWIIAFGTARRSHGADVISLDRKGRKQLREEVGAALYNQIRPLLDTYVVLSDEGVLVTAAHRLKRRR